MLYIARIFDPIGFLAPLVFAMKVILQKLWLTKVEWDDLIPPYLETDWIWLMQNINQVSSLHIPRCIVCTSFVGMRLVGFCDSSEQGYAAAVYLCIRSDSGHCYSHLLKAKTKVAPLKVMSIPRLVNPSPRTSCCSTVGSTS